LEDGWEFRVTKSSFLPQNTVSVADRYPQGTNFGRSKVVEEIFVGGMPTPLAGQTFLI
jgi:hypothetical protein